MAETQCPRNPPEKDDEPSDATVERNSDRKKKTRYKGKSSNGILHVAKCRIGATEQGEKMVGGEGRSKIDPLEGAFSQILLTAVLYGWAKEPNSLRKWEKEDNRYL